MRILFLTPRPPWPGRRGDQVRTSGLVRVLAERHEVHLLCQCWPGQEWSQPEDTPLAGLDAVEIGRVQLAQAASKAAWSGFWGGEEPMQTALFHHRIFEDAAAAALSRLRPDVVVIVLSRLGFLLDRSQEPWRDVPVVLDLIDALGANMRRRGDREPWLAPLWRREAKRLDAWDRELIRRAEIATVVADRDRRELVSAGTEPGGGTVEVVPFGLEVPESIPEARDQNAETVVLTGNLGYFPTVEGARYFAAEVWPEIKRRRPRARWILAGARPSKSVQTLASEDGVELIADPSDLSEILAHATVAIAPLRAGSGTPIKILEAMAAGVPVVTTPAGRDGLDELPDDCVSVASSSADFVDQIEALLVDSELRAERRRQAFHWLRRRHHLPEVVERFESLLEHAIAARRPGPR